MCSFRRRVFYGGVFYFLFTSFLFAQIPRQLSDWRQAAKDAITQNDITLAVFYYQQIQQAFADTSYATDAQCRIVNVYLQSNQPDEAAEALSRLKQNYSSRPEYVQLVHELGWEFVKKRDYATALRIYKDLQAQFPAHQRAAWFGRSVVQTYLEAGDIAGVRQAVEDLKNNYASHPDYAGQMNSTANRLRGKRQYEIAETIYSHLLARLPGHKDAVIWKRMQIQNLLDMGQADSAKTEVETLWSAYKDRAEFVKQAHELGWEFVRNGDYATGLRIYKGLLEQFPNHERTPWFRRSIVQTYLEAGETQKALEAVEQMKDNFAAENGGQSDLFVRQMERLMNNLLDKGQPAEAKNLSAFLLEKFPNHSRLVWLLHYKARSEVAMKEPNLADATVEVMRQRCGTDPNYAEALSWTAYNYRKAGCWRRAIELYENVLSLTPDKVIQLRCAAGIAQAYVRLGDDAKVQEYVDTMVLRYKDNPKGLAFYLFGVAEEYYDKALGDVVAGQPDENVRRTLTRAIEIGRNPAISSEPRVIYFLSVCYRCLGRVEEATLLYNKAVAKEPALSQRNEAAQEALAGDRYCGAYAVWHLLKYYGKAVSIDDIVVQMGISQKGFATVQDIVKTLRMYEIDAEAMQIATDKAAQLNTPFVQYRIPAAGNELGHFVLCIPAGVGKAIMLDGVEEPRAVDLTVYEAKEFFWDGTIILIQQSREDYLEQIVSQQISWEAAQSAGRCWLEDSSSNYLICMKVCCSRLAEQKQAYLRGGCKYDCLSNRTTCYTVPSCSGMGSGCSVGGYVCTDKTEGKTCQEVDDFWDVKCKEEAAHPCSPKKRMRGDCQDGRCAVVSGSYGNCGPTVPQCSW